MITDTVIIALVCIMPIQQPREKANRFTQSFEQADSAFNKEFKLDIEALRAASKRAAQTADEKTKAERDKVMNMFRDIDFFRRKE